MHVMKTFLLSVLLASIASAAEKPKLGIYAWWVQDQSIVKERMKYFSDLTKNSGFEIFRDEYKSSEEALAKLSVASNPYDLAIVSGPVAEELHVKGRLENLSDLFDGKNYVPFIANSPVNYCLPYQWGAALYAKQSKTNPGVVTSDDMIEVATREYADFKKTTSAAVAVSLKDLKPGKEADAFFKWLEGRIPTERMTFTLDVLSADVSDVGLVYGWNGELEKMIAKNPKFSYVVPARPVVGVDYVCVMKNNRNNWPKNEALRTLVTTNASPEFIDEVVKRSLYFSPYMVKTNVDSKVKNEVVAEVQKSGYATVNLPEASIQKRISEWWGVYSAARGKKSA